MYYYKIVSSIYKSSEDVRYKTVQYNKGININLAGSYVGETPYDAIKFGKVLFRFNYILVKIQAFDYEKEPNRKGIGKVFEFNVLEEVDPRKYLHHEMSYEEFYKFTEGVLLTTEELFEYRSKISKSIYKSNIQRVKEYPVDVRKDLAHDLNLPFHR